MCFGFLTSFPEYLITYGELYDGPNDSFVYFSVYTYQGRCTTHGIIPNGPIICRICEENDGMRNGILKRPS